MSTAALPHPLTRRRFGAVALTGATLALAACSPTGEESGSALVDAGAGASEMKYLLPEGVGSGQPDGAFPRTVKHYAGETVVDSAPRRIVVTVGGQIDAVTVLGTVPIAATQAKYSGSGQVNSSGLVPQFVLDAFPEHAADLGGMVAVGLRVEPNYESIVALQPDLILTNSRTDPAIVAQFQVIAATVVTLGGRVDWTEDFLLIADTLGTVDAGQEYLDDYQELVQDVSGQIDHTQVVSALRFRPDEIEIYTDNTFSGSVLAAVGAARPDIEGMDGDKFGISLEQTPLADGDVIFYSAGDGDSEAALARAETNSLWTSLRGVQDGRTIRIDDAAWYSEMGPTSARIILEDVRAALS